MNLIRGFVRNPVAGNMLMILLLGGGTMAALRIPRELFPEFSHDFISVTVPYPGALPADIEKGICLRIEDRLTGMDGIEEIASTSREGMGSVTLKLYTDANVRKVLDEVKSEIDKIDFPLDAEDPIVVEGTQRIHVIQVAVAGQTGERTLKELIEDIRDEINDLPEVSQVVVLGVQDYEIVVELTEASLRRHGLTLGTVARAIRDSSLDLPAGTVKSRGGDITVRVEALRYRPEEFRNVPILHKPDGTLVTLEDVADSIEERFEERDIVGRFNGKPAALVSVYKAGEEDVIAISDAVHKYVERKQATLPEGITLETWSDLSKLVRDRMDMLVRNGLWGLALVFATLLIFLGFRLSFWVAVGIPISLLGTILVLHLGGTTLNMMSMFALIMALGLIVDDAIIVGENIYAHVEGGSAPAVAAVEGTRAVLFPVLGAVLTTWLAFAPLAVLPGIMGRFLKILPLCVILSLAFSLVECLLILPPHLAHSLRRRLARTQRRGGSPSLPAAVRARIDGGIRGFIDGPFSRLFSLAVEYRYVTMSLAVGVLVVIVGANKGGRIKRNFVPKFESDTLLASVRLPTGTPSERTAEVTRRIAQAAERLNEQFPTPGGDRVVRKVYSLLGQQILGAEAGSHVAEAIVELLPTEDRGPGIRSAEVTRKWRENIGRIHNALSLRVMAFRGGPGGKALEIRLLGPDNEAIEPAAELLKRKLDSFAGVSDVDDDAVPGKMEFKVVRLKPGARNLGISLAYLAGQLRDAFYGNESLKVQRGRDEIKVMVRYPRAQRSRLSDVERMRIRTPAGDELPFQAIAEARLERGYTTLRRVAGKSVITVSADIDEEIANAEDILGKLKADGSFADLARRFPGVRLDLRGQRHQSVEAFESLYVTFPLALLGIYTILAAIFRSYVLPLIIMVAIPFGLVGAVVGHWIVGFDITLLSLFGMVALTGIVVNDSLVLIDLVNRKVRAGGKVLEAVAEAARRRFRPIILTTVTTVAGMAPILAERSFQAQFFKPMVVAIAFGLSFATLLTLLVVPSLYVIGNDLRRTLRWLRSGRWPGREEVVRIDPSAETEEGKA